MFKKLKFNRCAKFLIFINLLILTFSLIYPIEIVREQHITKSAFNLDIANQLEILKDKISKYERLYVDGLMTREEAQKVLLERISSLNLTKEIVVIAKPNGYILSHSKEAYIGSTLSPYVQSKLNDLETTHGLTFALYNVEGRELTAHAAKSRTFEWVIGIADYPSYTKAKEMEELVRKVINVIAVGLMMLYITTLFILFNIKDPSYNWHKFITDFFRCKK